MPAAPNSLHWLRLAEALYYQSRAYLDYDGWNPPTFDQLDEHGARYYHLARYLVERRARPQARPVTPAKRQERALSWLTDTAGQCPGVLVESGTNATFCPML